MKIGGIIKCPECNKVVPENQLKIKRSNLQIESDQREDYFAGEDEKLCRKKDNLFIKAFCPTCEKKFEVMTLVEIKPIRCYSAETRSDLVMIDEEKEN